MPSSCIGEGWSQKGTETAGHALINVLYLCYTCVISTSYGNVVDRKFSKMENNTVTE